MMRILTAILGLLLATWVQAVDYAPINWEDLQGKLEYDDPFLELTEEQRYYLSIYARLETLEKYSLRQVTKAMREQKQQAEEWLIDQGVDIQYLLDNRERITELRREAASKTNPELDQADIEMGGFMLALDMIDGKVSEFLLVPTVGACIHTPPPPPNQIVLVKPREPVESKSPFEAVRVKGRMSISEQNSSLFMVDGQGNVNSGYLVDAEEVSKF